MSATKGALRLGTRGSELALAQARGVATSLGAAELVPIRSSGDGAKADPQDKSRFVREIERALLANEVDLGVHSAKDLPGELPEGLAIVGVPAREDPRDALCGPAGSLGELAEGARVGTASLRRRAQLLALRPDLEVTELRGNVDTRLGRLAAGEFDAIVLAAAGLRRLGRAEEIACLLPIATMTPAPGQGALALEARAGDQRAARAAGDLNDFGALTELTAERAVVAALGASCHTPVGALARLEGERLAIEGFAGLPDGSEWVRDRVEGEASDPAALGAELGARMSAAGAAELLARAAEVSR